MNLFLPQMISSGILAVILFILLLPTLSLTVRRLLDTERNGALILITVAPLAIMAVMNLLSVLFFTTTGTTQVSQTQDNGWRIIDVPDEYIAENGNVLWDSIKDPNVIETYSYDKDGDIVMEPKVDVIYVQKYDKNGKLVLDVQESPTKKANDKRLIASTAGIQSLLFLFWIISFVIMIVWCAQPGTEGPNKYGPDPSIME